MEVRDFLDDGRPDKRRLWVERILQAAPDDSSYKDAYVQHFANVWRSWLPAQTTSRAQQLQPKPNLEAWLRERLRANVGYDRLVRELLTQPSGGNQGAAAFYQANEFKPENLAGSTAWLFLGVKLGCAQCHDHPFDRWKRTQFWQFAAFFTNQPGRVGGQIQVPGQDRVVKARFLDGTEPQWKEAASPQTVLAEWLTAADNPYFARAAVNRLWSYFFGVGLADPKDSANGDAEIPVAHQRLLDELARQLVDHGYDLKFLIRALIASQAYQRTSVVSHPSQKVLGRFARMPLRGLSPEQLFDSLAEATEYETAWNRGLTPRDQESTPRGRFLARFVAQEPKIHYQTSILQTLYLMNNAFMTDRTSLQTNPTLATLAEQGTSTARKVDSLFLVVLSRQPRPEESARFVRYVEQGGPANDPKQALADVFWVLLNSPEFMLNH
jgi:hypothetical protein